jgi:hypothetical protein
MIARGYVQPGEYFTVEAVVQSNMRVRGVNLTLQMPETFAMSGGRFETVNLDDITEKVISWEVGVPEYVVKGSYPISVGMVDPSGNVKSVTQSVSVLEPTHIQIPIADVQIDIPPVSVIQDRTFTAIKSYFVVVYSQKTLVLVALVVLLGAGYLYYSRRKRNSVFV